MKTKKEEMLLGADCNEGGDLSFPSLPLTPNNTRIQALGAMKEIRENKEENFHFH